MFSPSSGNLNSVTSADVDGRAGGGSGDATVAGCPFGAGDATCGAAGVAGFIGEAALAPPEPLSTVKITCPTLIFSPSLTRTSLTTPLTDDGTSTTALSVSSSITGSPSDTVFPGETISRTRSP